MFEKAKVPVLASVLLVLNFSPIQAQNNCSLRQIENGQLSAAESIQCLAKEVRRLRAADRELSNSTAELLPEGAVIAFLSAESSPCKGENWTLYEDAMGRAIIGAGTGDGGLTARSVETKGGAETVQLKISNLPPHDHKHRHPPNTASQHGGNLYAAYSERTAEKEWFRLSHVPNGTHKVFVPDSTTLTGLGVAHENMPPFVALYYCIRN